MKDLLISNYDELYVILEKASKVFGVKYVESFEKINLILKYFENMATRNPDMHEKISLDIMKEIAGESYVETPLTFKSKWQEFLRWYHKDKEVISNKMPYCVFLEKMILKKWIASESDMLSQLTQQFEIEKIAMSSYTCTFEAMVSWFATQTNYPSLLHVVHAFVKSHEVEIISMWTELQLYKDMPSELVVKRRVAHEGYPLSWKWLYTPRN
jgi:hypothetical protein